MRIWIVVILLALCSSTVGGRSDRVIAEVKEILYSQGYKPPPIKVVDEKQYLQLMGVVHPHTAGFRRWVNGVLDKNVYIVSTSWEYRQAEGQSLVAMVLASSVVHEMEHDKGPAEIPAYEAQLKFLQLVARFTSGAQWAWLQARILELRRYIEACRPYACVPK